MLFELFSLKEVEKLPHPVLKQYLKTRFKEIGGIKRPGVEGYFVYVEHFSALYQRNALRYVTLSSIAEGLFSNIEGISFKQDIVEVSLLFNNEFLLTLVFYQLDEESRSLLLNATHHSTEMHNNSIIVPDLIDTAGALQYNSPFYTPPTYPQKRNCPQSSSHGSPEMSGAMLGVGMLLLRCLLKR